MLRVRAGGDVTSSSTARPLVGSSKSVELCTIRWICVVTCRVAATMMSRTKRPFEIGVAARGAAGVGAPQASVVRRCGALEIGNMALKRMDNVGIVVEDLAGTIEFFRELGLELE